MELLKKIPFNFRYYLFTTTKKEIIVIYYKSASTIEENTTTLLEATYIPIFEGNYEFIPSQTIKVSCPDDDIQLKDFNRAIRDYCNARKGYTKFLFFSASPSYEILFEKETVQAIFASCKNVYLEIGEGGAIETGKEDYEPIDFMEIRTGNWFVDGETTIYIKDLKVSSVKLDIYNKGKKSGIFNLVIGNTFKGSRVQIYSTLQLVILNSSKTPSDFLKGKISFAVFNIFGEELLDDTNQARIEIRGFEKVNLSSIDVEKEVKYGNIIYLDNVTKFSLLRIRRTIKDIVEGSFAKIDRVGSTSIHEIKYDIDKNTNMQDNTPIVTFLHHDGDSLEKSLNIYETSFENDSGKNVVICKLINTELLKLYISKCKLNNGVIMLEKDDDSKVTKFNYNECTFTSKGDFEISNAIKLSLTDVDFNIDGKLSISCPNISINRGLWKVGNLVIDDEKEIIGKIVMDGLQIDSPGTIDIKNSIADDDFSYYDNSCKIKAKKYSISGYKPTYNESLFMCDNIDIACASIVTFTKTNLGFKSDKSTMNIKSSMSGSILFSTLSTDPEKDFILKLEDVNFHSKVNSVEFTGTGTTPKLNFNTNTPIKFTLNNVSSKYINFAYTQAIESEQKSKIIYKLNVLDIENDPVVLNNSEKFCTINKSYDDNKSTIFEIVKK